MKQSVKVSVVIPVYNVERYLKQCLDSLCNQTLKDMEIICVDDGSSDGSLAILREYAQRDPKIRVFENKEEGAGAAHARNMGVAQAVGEYLLILDSDDYFSLELAEKTYEKAISTGADMVIYDAQEFDSSSGEFIEKQTFLNTDLLPKKEVFSPKEIARNLFHITNGSPWNKLYRTAFVKEHHLKFQPIHVIDDSLFTFSSYAFAEKITYMSDKFVFYRGNNQGSQVFNTYRDPLSPVKMLSELQKALTDAGLFSTYQECFLESVEIFSNWYFRTLSEYGGFKLLYESLQQQYLSQFIFAYEEVPEEVALWGKEIADTSCEDYLFRHYVATDVRTAGIHVFSFPKEEVQKDSRVILYGAGFMGRAFYGQNALCQYCKIVAWVDRNYENIGFPVTGLESFSLVEFDKVIIGINTKSVCDKVKESLLSLGVPLDKIVLGVE